jgi:malonyl-CoA decarboxylase
MVPTWMSQMFDVIADLGRHYLENPGKKHSLETMTHMCQTLLVRRGEASGTALAKDIVDSYNGLKTEDRVRFLRILNNEFAPDPNAIVTAAKAYIDRRDSPTLQALSRSVEPPRLEMLRLLNIASGGTAAIIDMRRLLLLKIATYAELSALEYDLFHVLSAWFNRGFLQFQRVDWHTPAVVLEKLIAYEAVHEIKGWRDLRRRLADDRRCFAFFHPVLPDEPLIFVQVALTRGIAEKIQPLLSQRQSGTTKTAPDTAIFYSISNCQEGLKGISFGNFLIKQVVDSISQEMPRIKVFSTLSPIPRFNQWLQLEYLSRPDSIFSSEEKKWLARVDWYTVKSRRQQLKRKLMRLCALYLSREKKGRRPYDPVTRFHLGNGARIENINWEADLSERGLKESAGLMVNYRYDPTSIITNHEAYVNEGRIVLSSKVKKLLD